MKTMKGYFLCLSIAVLGATGITASAQCAKCKAGQNPAATSGEHDGHQNHAQGTGQETPKSGPEMGGMMGGRMQGMQMRDMQTIHALFAAHEKIARQVTNLNNGVETLTESNDPQAAKLIIEHVYAMKARLEKKQPIRMWDPLFAEIFKYSDKIKLEVSSTDRGVKIIETSEDPEVVRLIQSHAQAVSGFVKEGMSGMHQRHELPAAPKTQENPPRNEE